MKNLIRIGTMLGASEVVRLGKRLAELGFECLELGFGSGIAGQDVKPWVEDVQKGLDGTNITISGLSVYDNPMLDTEAGLTARKAWATLIDACELFDTNVVCGFTGRVPGVSIHECMPKFKEVFEPLAKQAADKGVKLAFENCSMGGNWWTGDHNIALNGQAWEMMFNTVNMDNIGLEWEPCHQMAQLIDPMKSLKKWAPRIFHIHGKDATIDRDVISEYGISAAKEWCWHRTPGFGECNWADIISILRMNKYEGNIDIEGYHDPVYREEFELMGQVHALDYLKFCRGGEYVENIF